jgi:hypothetical protein
LCLGLAGAPKVSRVCIRVGASTCSSREWDWLSLKCVMRLQSGSSYRRQAIVRAISKYRSGVGRFLLLTSVEPGTFATRLTAMSAKVRHPLACQTARSLSPSGFWGGGKPEPLNLGGVKVWIIIDS